MKIDFNVFLEMVKTLKYDVLKESFVSKTTDKKFTEYLFSLDERKELSNDELETLCYYFNKHSEEGFEEGFKVACEILQMMFITNNQQHTTTKKGMVFNDKTFFDMVYYNNDDTYSTDIYSDETAHKINELDNLLKEKISSQEYLELSSKINVVEADLQSDCFKSGLFTGINLMKYLLK